MLHEKTGFLYPVNDLAQAVQHLVKLYENAQLRREMGTEARLRVMKDFSMDQMITRTQKLLARLLQSKSREQLSMSTLKSTDPVVGASLSNEERRPN